MLDDQGLLLSIFKDIRTTEWVELCLVNKDKKGGRTLFFHDPLELLEAAEKQGDSVHCYFGVAPRKNRSGVAESVERAGVVWADFDAKDYDDEKMQALAASDLLVLPPSYLLDTGHGYHAYWLLSKYAAVDSVCEVVEAVGDVAGGGHVSDSLRRMRIPGTYNIKDDEPLLCTVISARPDLRYDLQDILRATKISIETRRSILTGLPGAKVKDRTRSGVDWQVATELTKLGISKSAMQEIWKEHEIGEKAREEGAKYLDRTLTAVQARKKKKEQGKRDPAKYYAEEADSYFVDGIGKQGLHMVSTFVFKPRRLLEGIDEDVFLGDIHAGGNTWEDIRLPKSAFLRIDHLMRHLGRASWQWLGSDVEVRFLLPYLVQQWKELGSPKALATEVLGRHGEHWVAPEYTLSATETLDIYSAPVVYTDPSRVAPRVAYPAGADGAFLQQVYDLLPQINHPDVIWPIIGWFMATPYKPILNEARVSFPHLSLYGTTGAGKTGTLEGMLMPLMGYIPPARSEDCSTTPFVLLSLLASTNAIPVSLAEFRRSSLKEQEWRVLLRTLLLAYDVGHDSRGRPSQTTVDYPLHAPLVLSGEDVVSDPAVQRRSIIVGMTPQTIETGSAAYKAYMTLATAPLTQFAAPYIQHTLTQDDTAIIKLWNASLQEVTEVIPDAVEERVVRNFATALFGVRSYEAFMESREIEIVPTPVNHVLGPVTEVHIDAMGRGYVLLDSFVTDVINEAARASSHFVYHMIAEDGVLWFHLTTALRWWRRERLARRQAILDSAAIKRQLRELNHEIDGEGHYVWGPMNRNVKGTTHRMYGLHIKTCFELGLDIPDTLKLFQQTLTFRGSTEQ